MDGYYALHFRTGSCLAGSIKTQYWRIVSDVVEHYNMRSVDEEQNVSVGEATRIRLCNND